MTFIGVKTTLFWLCVSGWEVRVIFHEALIACWHYSRTQHKSRRIDVVWTQCRYIDIYTMLILLYTTSLRDFIMFDEIFIDWAPLASHSTRTISFRRPWNALTLHRRCSGCVWLVRCLINYDESFTLRENCRISVDVTQWRSSTTIRYSGCTCLAGRSYYFDEIF